MPKPETAPAKRPPPERASPPDPRVTLAYNAAKIAGIVVGLPAALVSVSALIGAFTENGWVRAIAALVLVIGPPLFVADRLLPGDDPTRGKGVVSDVCAVTWVLVAFLVGGAFHGSTKPLLTREGDRLTAAGWGTLAQVAYVLGGVAAAAPPPSGPDASGSGSAAGSASAPLGSASGSASAPAPATSDSAPPASSAPKKTDKDKGEKTPAELFKENAPSVVNILVKARGGEGGGTGFLIDREGTIATNHHVIDGATQLRVKFLNGAVFEDVELLVDEPAADLALLRIKLDAPIDAGPKVDAAPIPLGNSDSVVVGEHAVSIGNPLGLDHTLTDGVVSSRRLYQGKAWIQFSAPISPGNSGGPLFNMKGEVIGVTTATITGSPFGSIAQNINLAVPINELRKLIQPTYPGRRKFGSGGPSHW